MSMIDPVIGLIWASSFFDETGKSWPIILVARSPKKGSSKEKVPTKQGNCHILGNHTLAKQLDLHSIVVKLNSMIGEQYKTRHVCFLATCFIPYLCRFFSFFWSSTFTRNVTINHIFIKHLRIFAIVAGKIRNNNFNFLLLQWHRILCTIAIIVRFDTTINFDKIRSSRLGGGKIIIVNRYHFLFWT